MFTNISVMGRVIYIIYSIECYLKEREDIKQWSILLDALWSFPEYDRCIDDYADKVIECTPGCVLDEREDFNTFEYFREDELSILKKLYTKSESTGIVDYLIEKINEIMGHNLYTCIKAPELYSLEIINDTYRYIKNIMGKSTPLVKPFEIYSIYEEQGWGNYELGRTELLAYYEKVAKFV